jgi:hypothetical protein
MLKSSLTPNKSLNIDASFHLGFGVTGGQFPDASCYDIREWGTLAQGGLLQPVNGDGGVGDDVEGAFADEVGVGHL